MLADRPRGLVDDAVRGRPPLRQREVVARELELEPDHVRLEDAQRLLEQFLPGLVALERRTIAARIHRAAIMNRALRG